MWLTDEKFVLKVSSHVNDRREKNQRIVWYHTQTYQCCSTLLCYFCEKSSKQLNIIKFMHDLGEVKSPEREIFLFTIWWRNFHHTMMKKKFTFWLFFGHQIAKKKISRSGYFLVTKSRKKKFRVLVKRFLHFVKWWSSRSGSNTSSLRKSLKII